jgi:hypothetical protein
MRILIYIIAYMILTLKLYSEPIKFISHDNKTELCSNQELIIKWSGNADNYLVEAKTDLNPQYRIINFYKIENNTLSWLVNDKDLLNSQLTIKISDKNNPANFDEISNITLYQSTEILDQTHSYAVCMDDFVYLRIDAVGFGLTYQWYKDGTRIDGAVSNIFSINEADYSNSGTYTCKIFSSGTCDVVESQPISVYVATPTKFTTTPEEIFWEFNKSAFMFADLHTNFDLKNNDILFKWYKDTTIMTVIPPKKYKLDTIWKELKESKKYIGTNTQLLEVSKLVWNDQTIYHCVAQGLCGSDTVSCKIGNESRFEVVKLSPDYYDCEGQDVVFKAKVVSNVSANFTYQWYKLGYKKLKESSKYIGTNTLELIIKNAKYDEDLNNYYILVTWVEKKVSKPSEHFILNPNIAPRITVQPRTTVIKDRTNKFFGQTYLDVGVANIDGCLYTWYRNGKQARKKCHESNYWIGIDSCPPYGALSPPPPRPAVPEDVGWYICKIENDCGETWSDSAYVAWNYFEFSSCIGNDIKLKVDDVGNDFKYIWEFGGTVLKESEKYINAESNQLHIRNLVEKDYGYYTVFIVNKSSLKKVLLCKVFVEVVKSPYIIRDLPNSLTNTENGMKQIALTVISDGPYLYYEVYLDNSKIYENTKFRNAFYYNDYGFVLGGKNSNLKPGVYQYYLKNDCGEIWSNKMTVINSNYKPGGIIIAGEDEEVPSDVIIMNDNEFKVYPNPASDFITIQIQPSEGLKPSEGYQVKIFNMVGIEVGQSSLIVNPNNSNGQAGMLNLLKIDISHLIAGVYFIRIGDRVEKFVKM